MRLWWAVLMIVLGTGLSAFAGSPQIGILDPACTSSSGFTNIFSVNDPLNITPTSNGGGTFTFCNLTGQTWSSVRFTAEDVFGFSDQTWVYGYPFNPSPAFITCSPGTAAQHPDRPYSACVVEIKQNDTTAGSQGTVFMTFFNADTPPDGVHSGFSMTVTLNANFCEPSNTNTCNSNTGDWTHDGAPVPLTGKVFLTSVPEPAGVMLLGSGLVGLAFLVRKRRY